MADFDWKRAARVVEALKLQPCYRKVAVQYAKIPMRTFSYWVTRGKKVIDGETEKPTKFDQDCASFVRAIEKAEADGEFLLAKSILRAAEKEWKAAAWYLERRFSQRWALVHKVKQLESGEDEQGKPDGTDEARKQAQRILTHPDVAAAVEAAAARGEIPGE